MEIKLNELLYELSFALDCVEHELLGSATHHSKRVAYLCLRLGRLLDMEDGPLSDMAGCAVLHDNALTEYILSERARGNSLSRSEKRINLENHCILGEENAKDFPFLHPTAGIILYHHENADGSGLFGKRCGEIPLAAAVIRLADNIDVLFNLGRARGERFGEVRRHVVKNEGVLYNPLVAQAFLSLAQEELSFALGDDQLDVSLRAQTPQVTTRCTNEQLLRVAAVFAKIIDYKSHFTRRHSSGIALKAYTMATYYHYSEDAADRLTLAASLHDVGKLAVPTALLEKPGKLTPPEFEIIKEHALYTHRILGGISGLEEIDRWASAHHEKLDGGGYPFGLGARELDFNSRLLACIDIYQALTEDRPYRSGMTHAGAMEILGDLAGRGQLDASIVRDLDEAALKEELAV